MAEPLPHRLVRCPGVSSQCSSQLAADAPARASASRHFPELWRCTPMRNARLLHLPLATIDLNLKVICLGRLNHQQLPVRVRRYQWALPVDLIYIDNNHHPCFDRIIYRITTPIWPSTIPLDRFRAWSCPISRRSPQLDS